MKTIKVSEAQGAALDLLVSRADANGGNDGWGWFEIDAEGHLFDPLNECRYSPSTDWAQGGPIIEQELIRVIAPIVRGGDWVARIKQSLPRGMNGWYEKFGPTPLIAAMRCYAASKLGDTVEIPKEI